MDKSPSTQILHSHHVPVSSYSEINSDIPEKKAANEPSYHIDIENYGWKKHCDGLFELPIAC